MISTGERGKHLQAMRWLLGSSVRSPCAGRRAPLYVQTSMRRPVTYSCSKAPDSLLLARRRRPSSAHKRRPPIAATFRARQQRRPALHARRRRGPRRPLSAARWLHGHEPSRKADHLHGCTTHRSVASARIPFGAPMPRPSGVVLLPAGPHGLMVARLNFSASVWW
jgi:hypothetical protein